MSKSNVHNMPDHREWKELFVSDDGPTTVQIFMGPGGEIDIVQMNSEGESITTSIPCEKCATFIRQLQTELATRL